MPPTTLEDFREPIANELKKFGKIPAIKLARGLTGCDLRDAKDFVDSLEETPRHYPLEKGYASVPGTTWESRCATCGETRGKHGTRTAGAPAGRAFLRCKEIKGGGHFTNPNVTTEDKTMPTRQYGSNQKMLARFPGRCFLCSQKINEGTDTILPLLSERTARGRHPWVHEACANSDTNGYTINKEAGIILDEAEEIETSRFLVDTPRVSQRQIDVVGKNLEAILKALANNPAKAFALVPVTETPQTDAVVVTEAIEHRP
jgi:hypothetical protein